jgi:hypothetical protein
MLMNKFLEATNDGRIFSATFVKKDGTIRTMNCRRKVTKGVTGKGLAFKPSDKGLIVVYDMHKDGFRMINLNTLIEAQVNGQIFKFSI